MTQSNDQLNTLASLFDKLSLVARDSEVNEKIARYVEKNYNQIVFLTAMDASKVIGVSQGSVSRFCIKMGFKGYNDFTRYLQKVVSSEMTVSKRLSFLAGDDDSTTKILESEINNIQQLQRIVKQPAYQQIVASLADSAQVTLLSYRMSATLMPYMNYILTRLRKGVHEVKLASPEWDNLDFENPKENTIFTIVLPRYSKVLLSKLQRLHDQGFNIIAITDSRLSPVIKLASSTILVPITVSSVFDVYSTPLLLINLIMRDVAKRLPDIDQRLQDLEKQNQKNNVFDE